MAGRMPTFTPSRKGNRTPPALPPLPRSVLVHLFIMLPPPSYPSPPPPRRQRKIRRRVRPPSPPHPLLVNAFASHGVEMNWVVVARRFARNSSPLSDKTALRAA